MFFLLPINTDAPVYHWPRTTLSLIVVNTLVYLAWALGGIPERTFQSLMLTYGDGLRPLQWVTSLFLHAGLFHLIGNMFFLWGFGIVVEGKIGAGMFLAAYLAIGMGECAIEQLCFLNSTGASLGASSAIFGVMAMALVWAPKNEITFFYGIWLLIFVRFGTFELTILTFSLLEIGKECLFAWLLELRGGSAVLHLLGAALGLALGAGLLRMQWVDCEGWDLFSVLRGTHQRSADDPYRFTEAAYRGLVSPGGRGRRNRKRRRRPARRGSSARRIQRQEEAAEPAPSPAVRIHGLLQAGKVGAALNELRQQQHFQPEFRLNREDLHRLAQGLLDARQWSDAVLLLEEYLDRFPDGTEHIRVQTARVLLHKQRRPRAALKMIEPLERSGLPRSLRRTCEQIAADAHELIDSGVIELSGHAWE